MKCRSWHDTLLSPCVGGLWLTLMLLVIILRGCDQERWEDDCVVLCVWTQCRLHKCAEVYQSVSTARSYFSFGSGYCFCQAYLLLCQNILKCTFAAKQSFVWLCDCRWVLRRCFQDHRCVKQSDELPEVLCFIILYGCISHHSVSCLSFFSRSLSHRPWRTLLPSAWPSITQISPPDCWMFLPEMGGKSGLSAQCVSSIVALSQAG